MGRFRVHIVFKANSPETVENAALRGVLRWKRHFVVETSFSHWIPSKATRAMFGWDFFLKKYFWVSEKQRKSVK